MNEVDFRNWLNKTDKNRKVQGDIVSRVKAIQRFDAVAPVEQHKGLSMTAKSNTKIVFTRTSIR